MTHTHRFTTHTYKLRTSALFSGRSVLAPSGLSKRSSLADMLALSSILQLLSRLVLIRGVWGGFRCALPQRAILSLLHGGEIISVFLLAFSLSPRCVPPYLSITFVKWP